MHLASWAAFLAVGIAIAISVVPTAVASIAVAAVAAAAILAWLRSWSRLVVVSMLLCGLGLGWRETAVATSPGRIPENQPLDLTAQVVQGADFQENGNEAKDEGRRPAKRRHLLLRVDKVDGQGVDAALSLLVLDGDTDVAPGDWVRFSAQLYRPRGFSNPGMLDPLLLARGQGVDLVATIRNSGQLRRIEGSASVLCYCRRIAGALRRKMAKAINHQLHEPIAGFVRTMVLGERTEVPEQIEDGFRAAGATHVLSVSGLHLAVVVALFFQGARWLLGRRPSWSLRVPAKVAASVLSLPACFFYTLLTGEAVATVRSAIMAATVLGATIVNRPVSLSASIAGAAMVLLVHSPLALLDVSFQLSFASVIGLGLFAGVLIARAPWRPKSKWGFIAGWMLRSFSASLAASLITAPLVAHHFGEVTPAAPLGNLILVPIVELVVLPCGLVGSLLGLAHPYLGHVPLSIAGLGSRLALALADGFCRFAPVALVRCPDWWETLLLVVAASCGLQSMARQARHRTRWLATAVVAMLVATGFLAGREIVRRRDRNLRVTFLDVGQGDSALIEGPGGFVALVDGGGRYDNGFDTGARIVEPVLRVRGVTRLDLVVLSHPHPDHMNGLSRILRRFPVGALWQNGDDGGNPAYHDFIALARDRGVSTPAPGAIKRDGLTIEAVAPWYDGRIAVPPALTANDASLVLRVRYAGRQILFPGDIGDEGEARLLERGSLADALRSEVVKVPHHGSRYASSDGFVAGISPWVAVVSAGRFNRFGLPSPVALERYSRRGVEVLRTDRDGAVTIVIDPAGALTVLCMRECSFDP